MPGSPASSTRAPLPSATRPFEVGTQGGELAGPADDPAARSRRGWWARGAFRTRTVGRLHERGRLGSRRRWTIEPGILLEDPLGELVEACGRVDAELVSQQGAEPSVHLEGLGGAAGTVEGKHQLGTGCFAQWVVRSERLHERDRVKMPAGRQEGLEPALDRPEVGLGELGDGALSGLVVGDLRKWVARPQPDGRVERRERVDRPTLSQVLAALVCEAAHANGVDGLRGYVEDVAGAAGRKDRARAFASAQGLAEVGDVGPERDGALRWRFAVPELLDESFRGDDSTDAHQEEDQQGALSSGRDRYFLPVDQHAERAEHLEVEGWSRALSRAHSHLPGR